MHKRGTSQECRKYDPAGSNVSLPVIKRGCTSEVLPGSQAPEKKFDITIITDDLLTSGTDLFSIIILLENFEADPAVIELNLTLFDEKNRIAFAETDKATVRTILWRNTLRQKSPSWEIHDCPGSDI